MTAPSVRWVAQRKLESVIMLPRVETSSSRLRIMRDMLGGIEHGVALARRQARCIDAGGGEHKAKRGRVSGDQWVCEILK